MAADRLYFAYGSNLHLSQMKRRCPKSKFIGKGQIDGYRWQINQRGYANIVKCEGSSVFGLCYAISPADEARLDINEGVAKGAYSKMIMPVEIERAHIALYRRPTDWIVDAGGPETLLEAAGVAAAEPPKTIEPEVLMYISDTYVTNGEPWDEYIDRINSGLEDARALGMSDEYIDNVIRPWIPKR